MARRLCVGVVAQTLGHVRFLLLYEAFSMDQSAIDQILLGAVASALPLCLFTTLHLLISTGVQQLRDYALHRLELLLHAQLCLLEIELLTCPRIATSSQLSAPLRTSNNGERRPQIADQGKPTTSNIGTR